jgi:hypothetical protein
MVCRWCMAVCVATLLPAAALLANDPLTDRRDRLVSEYLDQLETLATKCDELELAEQAALSRAWIAPYRAGRQVYFFADSAPVARLPATASERVQQWHARFYEVRRSYAEQLFALAREAAEERRGEEAFRWLHEVIHADSQHEEARRILDLPRGTARKVMPRAVPSDHRQFGWRRGRHWSLTSRRFFIESNHSAQACVELADELERLHDVWQQCFFLVWGNGDQLAERFRDGNLEWSRPGRFHVVLLKDRAEYLRQVTAGNRNAAVSSGIYLDERKLSLIVGGPEAKKATWYHEVAHQLFQESLQAPPGVATENNAWMVEAAALFMESLVLKEGHAYLGGYDASALQFARFRILGGDFYLPLAELSAIGRADLQRHADIRKIYSQSAALGHFFLESHRRPYREAFLHSLASLYAGRAKPDTLATACKTTFAQMDLEVGEFLKVTDALVAATPPYADLRDLSLRGSRVTNQGLHAFKVCDRLEWLDLSLTETTDEGWGTFPASKALRQLFLEGTRVTDAGAKHVAAFRELEELYLTATPITDRGIAELVGLQNLKQLDLARCPITDACVDDLAQLKQLEKLDLAGTKVTSEGKLRLQRALPKLVID